MRNDLNKDPILDMFIFETQQLLDQLEEFVLNSEKDSGFASSMNEIFRIMHTIKGSAAMMLFNNIASLAHSIEDLFAYLRQEKPKNIDYSKLTDIVLAGLDFIKNEVGKIEAGKNADGDPAAQLAIIKEYLASLRGETAGAVAPTPKAEEQQKFYLAPEKKIAGSNKYKVLLFFEEGCEMENVRAFNIIHSLKEWAAEIEFSPQDILENNQSAELIKKEGFQVTFNTELALEEVKDFFSHVAFLKEIDLKQVGEKKEEEKGQKAVSTKQSLISVNIFKLDQLMDLVGELVIAEAMVTRNPELAGLPLDNFHKAARQLRKITGELQDVTMSMRMVSLAGTFQKMNRLVRDMSRKVGKEVELEIIGAETEVDKNIIEQIGDPLMHLIRNSLDHGIESSEERQAQGKSKIGKITLEAKNSGGDVWVLVRDDGRGLNKEKILQKAKENGLLTKPEQELTDKEIYAFILVPGFSTKEKVTEFSGRGVGMDVVMKNIEKIRGTVFIDSTPGKGTTISIKIPLTLAIIDGMTIKVGSCCYTIPINAIKECLQVKNEEVITDPEGKEMILIRGQCYPILRLHELYQVTTEVTDIEKGTLMMVEHDSQTVCLLVDALLGEQQVVVKALPKFFRRIPGIAGCTLLGDGSISLILNVAGLIN